MTITGELGMEQLKEQILPQQILTRPTLAPVAPIHVVTGVYPMMKRGLDVIAAFFGLVVSLPLWIIISAAIKLEDGGPVFYYKICRTLGGHVFKQLKFRSMIPDAEKKTGPVLAKANDERITRVGKILRKTAMDELPQLVNILMGDMSFVGPRPQREVLVKDYVRKISHYDERHRVRPGLTGLAQVYGRYFTPPRQKLRFDLLYVKKINFLLDFKLVFLSFMITFKAKWDSLDKKRV